MLFALIYSGIPNTTYIMSKYWYEECGMLELQNFIKSTTHRVKLHQMDCSGEQINITGTKCSLLWLSTVFSEWMNGFYIRLFYVIMLSVWYILNRWQQLLTDTSHHEHEIKYWKKMNYEMCFLLVHNATCRELIALNREAYSEVVQSISTILL